MAKARAKPKTQLSRREREKRALVARIIVILRRGEPSRFRYEAACRHGLRIGWVLQGWSWSRSDAAASEIVALALSKMGVARPSYEEGQPESVETVKGARQWCTVCGGELEFGQVRYCSAICGRIGRAKRERKEESEAVRIEYLARVETDLHDIFERITDTCVVCQKKFVRRKSNRPQKYCGWDCYHSAKRTRYRRCAQCGTEFYDKTNLRKYCSDTCYQASRLKTAICEKCGATFQTKHYRAKYCSPECSPWKRTKAA
mgnify:CR=1 FL=1